MKFSLLKDSLREIGKNVGRFISILMIVALGTAFFSGIKAAAPNMKATADLYYDDYNMMDIRILSTMGLTDDDIGAMKSIVGVESVQPSYYADVVTTVNSNEFVYRVLSLPAAQLAAGDENYLNKPKLVTGRLPEKSGECIIEDTDLFNLGLEIGDKITVSSGKKGDLTGVLSRDTFTIVGKAQSPYYLTYEKDATDIGSGKVNFFMMILSTDFSYPVYIEALITVNGAKTLNSYSTQYRKLIENVKNQLDNLVAERSVIRLAEIKKMAMEQLNKSKKELADNEEKFNTEIAEAQIKLDAAQDKLVGGQATLDSEKKNYETQIAAAQKQINDGARELAAGEEEYKTAEKKYNATKAEYRDALASLDQATGALNEIDSRSQTQIDAITLSLLNNPLMPAAEKKLLEDLLATLKENQASARSGIVYLNNMNSNVKKSMKDAEDQLGAAKKKLADSRAKLAKARADLAAAKTESQEKFAAAEKQIAEGQAEYDAAKKEFDTKKADGAKQLADGKEQVIRGENQIESLASPNYYVLDRNQLYSYADYSSTADRMDAIAKLFPVFFFLVAALVCLTTMTRMIDEQRGTIGTFKALGYTNAEIAFKYVSYAILASAVGGILGVNIGIRVFPKIIFDAWTMMYKLPPMVDVSQVPLMILSVVAGIAVTTVAAYAACNQELKSAPSMLMRPKAPKAGKTLLLEKVRFLWNRLTFSQKVTMRNLFRYKKRFFMTIIGIAGCSALLVAGFGLSDSIGQIVDKQFKQIFAFNMSIKYTPVADDAGMEAVATRLNQNPEVSSLLKASQLNAKVKSSGEEISMTLVCPESNEELLDYINLRERISQKKLSLSSAGLIINEKLARELGVGVGDTVTVDNGDGAVKKLMISGITENYIFHYGYISAELYEEIFRLPPRYNSLLIKLNNPGKELEKSLGSELIAMDQVASVEYFSDAADKFGETIESLNAIVIAIIFCAGLLAFIVLYNLTNINLSERIREIATIKVLGFYNTEVATYVYRENVILSIVGAGVGLVAGIYLHRVIMASIEQTGIMFGDYIADISFVYSFAMTLVFTMLVNVFMYRKLNHIPMIESLKAVE